MPYVAGIIADWVAETFAALEPSGAEAAIAVGADVR
jgi:hypothetical protein